MRPSIGVALGNPFTEALLVDPTADVADVSGDALLAEVGFAPKPVAHAKADEPNGSANADVASISPTVISDKKAAELDEDPLHEALKQLQSLSRAS